MVDKKPLYTRSLRCEKVYKVSSFRGKYQPTKGKHRTEERENKATCKSITPSGQGRFFSLVTVNPIPHLCFIAAPSPGSNHLTQDLTVWRKQGAHSSCQEDWPNSSNA